MASKQSKQDERNLNITLNTQQEDKDEIIISLPRLMAKLKKYFLAWLLLAVIIGGIIAGISVMFTFTSTSTTKTSALVSFTYDGISDGKNPDGSDFDANVLRDPTVIEMALTACNMSLESTETIRQNITIKSITPQDAIDRITVYNSIYQNANNISAGQALLETKWISTQYELIFYYRKASFSSDDAVLFLNTMLDCFRDYFYQTYGFSNALGSSLSVIDYSVYDYAEAVDRFDSTLSTLKNYVDSLANEDTTRFRSTKTGYTFADLSEAIKTVRELDLDLISSYVTVNNVTKDKDRLQAYYEYRIEALTRDQTVYTEMLESVLESLENYQKDEIYVFGGTGSDTADMHSSIASDKYDELITQKLNTQNNLSRTIQNINFYNQRIASLRRATTGSTDKVERVESDLARLNETVNDLITMVNDTADDYYQNFSLTNAYNILVPASVSAVSTVKSGLNSALRPILGIEVVLLMLYLALAFIQALREDSAAAAARKAAAETADAASEPDAEADGKPEPDTDQDQKPEKTKK